VHVLTIFLLNFIEVRIFHEGKLVGVGSHLLNEELVVYLSSEGHPPQSPVTPEDLLDVLDLSSIVQVELYQKRLTN
jgi:hypothetical protein